MAQPVRKDKARARAATEASAGSSEAGQAMPIAANGSQTALPIPGNVRSRSEGNDTLAASVRRSLLSLRHRDDATASTVGSVHSILKCWSNAVSAAAATIGQHSLGFGMLADGLQLRRRAVVAHVPSSSDVGAVSDDSIHFDCVALRQSICLACLVVHVQSCRPLLGWLCIECYRLAMLQEATTATGGGRVGGGR